MRVPVVRFSIRNFAGVPLYNAADSSQFLRHSETLRQFRSNPERLG